MIAIVDYKAGNLTSVARALEYLGHRCEITDRPGRIRAADRVILPGVGAAAAFVIGLRAGLARVPGAPLLDPPYKLPRRRDEPGDVLVLSGTVRATDGAPLPGAELDGP